MGDDSSLAAGELYWSGCSVSITLPCCATAMGRPWRRTRRGIFQHASMVIASAFSDDGQELVTPDELVFSWCLARVYAWTICGGPVACRVWRMWPGRVVSKVLRSVCVSTRAWIMWLVRVVSKVSRLVYCVNQSLENVIWPNSLQHIVLFDQSFWIPVTLQARWHSMGWSQLYTCQCTRMIYDYFDVKLLK